MRFLLLFSGSLAQCPDADLQKRCTDICSGELNDCTSLCSENDSSCTTRCQATWLDCLADCPCNSNCPNGCADCQNPICNEPRTLMILNDAWRDGNYGFTINAGTDELNLAWIDYGGISIEDSCAVNFRGEVWVLGGWFNDRLVAKFQDNSIVSQPIQLSNRYVFGSYGSCAVHNNLIYMCFDAMWHYDDKCMTFDGEMQEEVEGRSIGEHDWSDLIEFQGQLATVGGCDSWVECNGITEFYTKADGWKEGPRHPLSEIYGHAISTGNNLEINAESKNADGESIFTIGGDMFPSQRHQIYRLKNNVWENFGRLLQADSSKPVNSAYHLRDFIFTGSYEIEKIAIVDDEMHSVILENNDFEDGFGYLYYALIFEI